jgi:hypothetical protein
MAIELKYITQEDYECLIGLSNEISRILSGLIKSLK